MNTHTITAAVRRWVLPAALAAGMPAATALAAGEPASWRAGYDLAMTWVNFLIMVALLVKVGRKPLTDMLADSRQRLVDTLEKAENQHRQARDRLEEARRQLEANEQRLVRVRERIVAQGRNEKKRMIRVARTQGQAIMESSRRRILMRFDEAHDAFRKELIDQAFDLALESLPRHVTDSDQQKQVQRFLSQGP